MKILFLCGSLEPGCDGVGDYTRRIAGELIRQGHQTSAIAINDRHTTKQFAGTQSVDEITLPVLRLSSLSPIKDRFARAKQWIEQLDPECLSLQFVPFSFHEKGLPFGLGKQLMSLGSNWKWHIMFHELWVGMYFTASIKEICWGLLQQKVIQRLIKKLNPDLIHTQTRLYRAQLMRLGFEARLLPLFGNIPVGENTNKLPVDESSSKCIRLVVFGIIHPKAPIEQFTNEIAKFSKKHNVSFSLTFIGRSGSDEIKRWINVWKLNGLEITVLGEQPPKVISGILTSASFGISSTPIAIAEKSGTIAAMLEHGLPVICVSVPWQETRGLSFEPPPGIAEYRNGNFEALIERMQKPKGNHAEQIALNLITSLESNESKSSPRYSTETLIQ